jgi:hypothetical protein
MKKFILAFIFILCFSISGCMSTIKNVPIIGATGTTTYLGHDDIVEIIMANLDIFSQRELTQLSKANDRLCVAKAKLDDKHEYHKGDIGKLVMDLSALVPLYEEAKDSYLVAHKIIMNRIDEFSVADRGILLSYSDTCLRLDIAIQESLTSEDGTNNGQLVKDIMSFVLLVGKIILPMLLVL